MTIHAGGQELRTARRRLLGQPCRRCGEAIDPTLSGLHPDGLTVGHVVPVSRGGSDHPSNLAAEHRRCNLAASDRVDVAPPPAAVVFPGVSSSARRER